MIEDEAMIMSDQAGNEPCPEREQALEMYLFDQLGEREETDLQDHLASCPRCRTAWEEVSSGLEALEELDEPPLPFGDIAPRRGGEIAAEQAWSRFVNGATGRGNRTGRWLLTRVAAAAALVLTGVGIGYWGFPGAPVPVEESAAIEVMGVEAEAVDALVRAEFLADLGLPWIDGVLELVAMVMELDQGDVATGNVETVRALARDLLRDGRLLQRRLEPDRDRLFLATIGRAAFFLEDVAVLGGEGAEEGSLRELRDTLQMTGLGDRLVALDVDGAVSEALEASGWIGEEYAQSRETRR